MLIRKREEGGVNKVVGGDGGVRNLLKFSRVEHGGGSNVEMLGRDEVGII